MEELKIFSVDGNQIDVDCIYYFSNNNYYLIYTTKEIDENGYVVADESTKTNVEGVYAVGDVRTKAFRQVVTAVSDGAVAVYYAENYINKF